MLSLDPASGSRPPARAQRGSVLLAALLVALSVGALALGLLTDGLAAQVGVRRTESSLRALQLAEEVLVRAELELASKLDPGADGCGSLQLTVEGGSASVICTPDPAVPERFTLLASAEHGRSRRAIEVVVRRRAAGAFIEGLFAHNDLVFDGNTATDAYNSSLGTYASQRVNADADGSFALLGGNVGSNTGFITLNGSAVTIRGDAIPGPGRSVNESGDPTVTGSTAPRQMSREVPAPTLTEFAAANAVNQNGTWTVSGTAPTWNATTKSLTVRSNSTLTLGAGTYFFSELRLSSNSTLRVTGPVKIYVTKSWDSTGGVLNNTTGKPANLMLFAHPYNLPAGTYPTGTDVKVAGGSGSALAMYGPSASLTISGNSDLYGAAVARSIKINGSVHYHYDKALDEVLQLGAAKVERLAWRDVALPTR